MKAKKTAKPSTVNYDPKTPIGILFNRLKAANGKQVSKEKLYKGIKAPYALLAWIKIHGANSGLWNLINKGETAALVFTKKSANAKKAA